MPEPIDSIGPIRVCPHGGLRYKCETCDLAAEVVRLTQERNEWKLAYNGTEHAALYEEWQQERTVMTDHVEAAEARLTAVTQERDKWLHHFNASEQYQSGPTKRAEAAKASPTAQAAALEGLEQEIRSCADILGNELGVYGIPNRLNDAADRLAALRTP